MQHSETNRYDQQDQPDLRIAIGETRKWHGDRRHAGAANLQTQQRQRNASVRTATRQTTPSGELGTPHHSPHATGYIFANFSHEVPAHDRPPSDSWSTERHEHRSPSKGDRGHPKYAKRERQGKQPHVDMRETVPDLRPLLADLDHDEHQPAGSDQAANDERHRNLRPCPGLVWWTVHRGPPYVVFEIGWIPDHPVKYVAPAPMDFHDSALEATFRGEIRDWIAKHHVGEFSTLSPSAGETAETDWELRVEWEKLLGRDRWLGLSWPVEYGGRSATFSEQVIFQEEYARAGAPARVSFFGEGLFAPTLIQFGTGEQQRRYLPKIQAVEEMWCQGFSEPNAGSDLANVQTRAVLDGDEWVIDGQKVWTTMAHKADWCFAITRTDPDSRGHKGLSYLMVNMHQPGVEVRPLRQMTGGAEFNEVFFDGVRTPKDHVLGPVGEGWSVAMATLGYERGTAFLARQLLFRQEMADLIALAQQNGSARDPVLRNKLAGHWIGVNIMQYNGQRMVTEMLRSGSVGPTASLGKLYWSNWHRNLGETAMQVLGADALTILRDGNGEYELDVVHQNFMASRAETIYAGASEIQRNIVGERVLGLPREPR